MLGNYLIFYYTSNLFNKKACAVAHTLLHTLSEIAHDYYINKP